ncbi:MAG: HAMP domain-containing histidine kinase [Roseburia sp.]|nr:HAMP domain-containing histidine kinase [Roseburia sp.]
MKQLKQSPVAKIIAWILITVSALMLLAGTAGAYFISELGFYTKSVQEIREEQFERIAGKYSARVLQNLNNTENETYFKDTNFRYGVVEASNYEELEKLDLNQQNTYVQSNFDEKVSLDNLHLFQCNMNADTSIYVENSVLGGYYIAYSTREYRNKYINEYVYDTDSGIFYYQVSDVPSAQISEEGETAAEIWYFPVSEVKVTLVDDSTGETTDYAYVYNTADKEYEALQQGMSEGDGQAVLCITIQNATGTDENDLHNVKNILENAPLTFWQLTATAYSYGTSDWTAEMSYPYIQEQQTEQVTVSETVVSAPTSVTLQTVELSYVGGVPNDEIKNRIDYDSSEADYLSTVQGSDAGTDYYVLSVIPDADRLVKKEGVGVWGSDYFVQINEIVNLADHMKYSVYVILALSLTVFVASFVYLVSAAGHKKDQKQVQGSFLCKVPADLFTVICLVAESSLAVGISLLGNAGSPDNYVFYAAAMFFLLLCGGWLALGYLLDFAVRIKLGKWWRNTLIYKVLRSIYRGWNKVGENKSILWKGLAIFLGVNFLEVLIFVVFGVDYSKIMIVWFAEKAVILFAGGEILIQMKRLQEGGKHIAEGDMDYQIDTEHMLPALKEHAADLNRINEGVSKAVNEKMKSERFKTELITNVSHDIKTPLTSIINYVDLLEKEEIPNENAKEYLEVLERQSARLKKLIEDLIEASKASSGSLSVNLEKLEAGVFLVQTVGEFKEKTEKNKLDLQIKKPEEPIYIMADGRHFWRVIDNLMNNICKYAQPETRVYINLEQTGEKVQITFRNTSRYPLNISSEELMERFVRGDSSRNTEGNGLGLSIAGSLMELMHGKMQLFVDGDLFKVVLEFDRCEVS